MMSPSRYPSYAVDRGPIRLGLDMAIDQHVRREIIRQAVQGAGVLSAEERSSLSSSKRHTQQRILPSGMLSELLAAT